MKKKLKEVNAKLAEQKEMLRKNVPDFKCDQCGQYFLNKIYRKNQQFQNYSVANFVIYIFSKVGDTKLT